MTKRKITFEQSQALEYGRSVMRRNRRARAAHEEAERTAATAAQHRHFWCDWSLNDDDVTESRRCRCGAVETREWKGL